MKFKKLTITIPLILLSACAKPIRYNPHDFINPNREIIKKVPDVSPQKIHATFGLGNDPAVEKAYQLFSQKGIAKNINQKGFKTFAYDSKSRPIITCAPLHLCVVQLEQGELINNIELGDSADWLISTALIGTKVAGSYQVALKPKLYDIATDMVITTNKRTYNIGLLSQKGQTTHVANFYYPEETLQETNQQLQSQQPLNNNDTMTNETLTNINHLNFDYVLKGKDYSWSPTRVFDDGDKTFIEMPAISERLNLPVLYILRNKTMALVNYRYKRPYYIIDGLFSKAFLISGKGENQERVEIDNKKEV